MQSVLIVRPDIKGRSDLYSAGIATAEQETSNRNDVASLASLFHQFVRYLLAIDPEPALFTAQPVFTRAVPCVLVTAPTTSKMLSLFGFGPFIYGTVLNNTPRIDFRTSDIFPFTQQVASYSTPSQFFPKIVSSREVRPR